MTNSRVVIRKPFCGCHIQQFLWACADVKGPASKFIGTTDNHEKVAVILLQSHNVVVSVDECKRKRRGSSSNTEGSPTRTTSDRSWLIFAVNRTLPSRRHRSRRYPRLLIPYKTICWGNIVAVSTFFYVCDFYFHVNGSIGIVRKFEFQKRPDLGRRPIKSSRYVVFSKSLCGGRSVGLSVRA